MTNKTLEFVLTLTGREAVLENVQNSLAEALTGFVEGRLSEMGADGVTIKVQYNQPSPQKSTMMSGLSSQEWLEKNDLSN